MEVELFADSLLNVTNNWLIFYKDSSFTKKIFVDLYDKNIQNFILDLDKNDHKNTVMDAISRIWNKVARLLI